MEVCRGGALTAQLDRDTYIDQYRRMSDDEVKRVTVNLPRHLLRDAVEVTGAGTTETIVQALQLLARRRAYTKALALKGKLDLRIDLDASRERTGR
jgi:hypothetical protein